MFSVLVIKYKPLFEVIIIQIFDDPLGIWLNFNLFLN